MKFAIAPVSYWDSIGFDTTEWRKSLDGTKAICHLDYAEKLGLNLYENSQVKIYDIDDPNLDTELEATEWVVAGTNGDLDIYSFLVKLGQFETKLNNAVTAKIEKTDTKLEGYITTNDKDKLSLTAQLKQKANQTKVDDIEGRMNDVIQSADISPNKDVEVVDGRGKEETLNTRLSKIENGKRLAIFEIGKNKFDKNDITSGKYIVYTTGAYGTNATFGASAFIEIDPTKNYVMSGFNEQGAFYDVNKTYISGFLNNSALTGSLPPVNAKYIRLSVPLAVLNTAQLEQGTVATAYEGYKQTLKNTYIDTKSFRFSYDNLTYPAIQILPNKGFTIDSYSWTAELQSTTVTIPTKTMWLRDDGKYKVQVSGGTYTLTDNQVLCLATDFASDTAQYIVKSIDSEKSKNEYPLIYFTTNNIVTSIPAFQSVIDAYFKPPTLKDNPTVEGKPSRNLFDKRDITVGKYVIYTTGALGTNAGYSASNYIPVEPNTAYSISGQNEQLAYYDVNKVYISGVQNVGANMVTPANAAYVRLTINNTFIDSVQYEKGTVASPFTSAKPILSYKEMYKNVILVAKNGGDYHTITEAVANADDSINPVTILVFPGTYEESVMVGGSRKISIIGVNKNECILKDSTGLYANAPLEIMGRAYIENMTFIATFTDENVVLNNEGSYAVHIDYAGAGITEFFNCDFISDCNASVGVGLHQDQTLIFRSCNFKSTMKNTYKSYWAKGVFVHGSATTTHTNQKVIFDNCKIHVVNGDTIRLANVGSSFEATFYNNMLWSDQLGKADTSIYDLEQPFVYTPDSYGNNVAKLNK